MQREFFDSSCAFSAPLRAMLECLEYVMPILPPLAMSLRPSREPPLIVYSDAMFTPRSATCAPVLRIGWVVYDPISCEVFHSHLELPPSLFSLFVPGLKTYIMQGAGIGAVAPALSLPRVFRGRHVIQFNDISGALSSLINGYASKPDMARIVNVYHLTQFYLRATVWLEWVPSKANIADLPSRLAYDAFFRILPHSRWVETVLPPAHVWVGPLRALAARVERML